MPWLPSRPSAAGGGRFGAAGTVPAATPGEGGDDGRARIAAIDTVARTGKLNDPKAVVVNGLNAVSFSVSENVAMQAWSQIRCSPGRDCAPTESGRGTGDFAASVRVPAAAFARPHEVLQFRMPVVPRMAVTRTGPGAHVPFAAVVTQPVRPGMVTATAAARHLLAPVTHRGAPRRPSHGPRRSRSRGRTHPDPCRSPHHPPRSGQGRGAICGETRSRDVRCFRDTRNHECIGHSDPHPVLRPRC
ncbi:Uncharacterised protein [Mycobacteroides abscessus subsp. abscessus]|nr:Uncharacterised protein [Mycobacteroides abscessus subsp. abscessus]